MTASAASRSTAALTGARSGRGSEATGTARPAKINPISREASGSRAERISLLDPASPASINARQLAQQIKRRAGRRRVRSIVVTSPLSGDGKTTIACNLAVALTRLDRSHSVCLVELDLRRPTMRARLGLQPEFGVDDVLARRASVDQSLLETDVPGLTALVVREPRHTPEQLLASENLNELIRELEARYWLVVIDTPPIQSVADAASVLEVAGGCVLVVRAGRSPTASVRAALDQLPSEKMLGCCLNFARIARRPDDYESYYVLPAESNALADEKTEGDEATAARAKEALRAVEVEEGR